MQKLGNYVEICSLDLDYYGQVIHECSSVT